MTELNGRVAIITGASSGIGAATAKALVTQGVKVVLAGRNEDKLNQVAQTLNEEAVHIVPTDVTIQTDVDALVAQAIDRFGQVDIFVNCAGLMRSSKITDYQVDAWDAMVDTNIKGLLYSLNAILPKFEAQGSGHVVNLASISANEVSKSSALYSATKSAVLMIFNGLEKELAKTGIKTTSILPGMVDTPMTEHSDFGGRKKLDPENIADAIVYALTQPAHVNVNEVTVRPV
ncbi:SDR family oxidoreductase [Staphylococcus sp. GDX8P80P]|uniref:SDR family oxidoreductase n=1 Tax=Staphylococcus sp. GDX8P80P TaxID=2804104 RepID=UPI001AEC3B26|nr:SDR family oxidoreductase [Staphylococcus sp. GDX8P80P]